VAALYSMTNLVQMEPFVDECSDLLVKRFKEFAQAGRQMDMGHWLQCYAFDVIGHISVAKRFGFLDAGEDISSMISAIDDYLTYLTHVGVFSEFHSTLYGLLSQFTKEDTGMSAIGAFAQAQLSKRKFETSRSEKRSSNQGDFITKLLQLHEADPSKVDMKDVFSTLLTNISAGSDTTSISLGSVIYHLCRYPYALENLRKELEDMEKAGSISNPVTFAQTQQMPYLQAVIKEALRMHPATGLPLGRVVPKGGKVISGQMFPEGVSLENMYLLRNVLIYVAECGGHQLLGCTRQHRCFWSRCCSLST